MDLVGLVQPEDFQVRLKRAGYTSAPQIEEVLEDADSVDMTGQTSFLWY